HLSSLCVSVVVGKSYTKRQNIYKKHRNSYVGKCREIFKLA
ncbi:unnamed protein product, partial [Callosobruchus maculatus]